MEDCVMKIKGTKSRLVNEITLGEESGEVETFGVDWSNPHEMASQMDGKAADSAE